MYYRYDGRTWSAATGMSIDAHVRPPAAVLKREGFSLLHGDFVAPGRTACRYRVWERGPQATPLGAPQSFAVEVVEDGRVHDVVLVPDVGVLADFIEVAMAAVEVATGDSGPRLPVGVFGEVMGQVCNRPLLTPLVERMHVWVSSAKRGNVIRLNEQ